MDGTIESYSRDKVPRVFSIAFRFRSFLSWTGALSPVILSLVVASVAYSHASPPNTTHAH